MAPMRSTVLVIVLATLLLSACGGSTSRIRATGEATKSAAQIILDAQSAVRSARSAHYTISVSGHSTPYDSNITQAAPDRIAGYYTARDDHRVTFVRDGRRLYLRSAPSFWTAIDKQRGSTLAKLTAGKWLLLPPFLARLTPAPTPSRRLDQVLQLAGTFLNYGDTTYNGQTVIRLGTGTANLYLRPSRPDYPVAFVDDDGTRFTFDHWNAPLSVAAPRHAIDLAKFGR